MQERDVWNPSGRMVVGILQGMPPWERVGRRRVRVQPVFGGGPFVGVGLRLPRQVSCGHIPEATASVRELPTGHGID